MGFADLNKEQKQAIILAVMGVITAISVVSNLIVGPTKEEAAQAKKNIKEFKSKVQTGEIVLQRDSRNLREIREFSEEILAVYDDLLPPPTSTYIWAVEQLSLVAENLDLVIEVREHGSKRYRTSPPYEPNAKDVSLVTMWVPYSIDVDMKTSFAKLQSFLKELRLAHPYISIGRITIDSGGPEEENNPIRLIVEWPTLRYEEDLDWMREQVTTGKK